MTKQIKKTTAILTLLTTMLGTGTNFMPYAFKSVGYIHGASLMIFFGVATFFSCYCLATVSKKSNSENVTYSSIAKGISNRAYYIISLSMLVKSYLPALNYYRYISDLCIKNFPIINIIGGNYEYSRKVVVFIFIPILLLTILKKSLASLSMVSYLSITSVVYISLLMVFIYLKVGSECAEEDAKPFHYSFHIGLPFFISSMICQSHMVKVYVEMEDKTEYDIIMVCALTAIGGMLMNGLIGLLGYIIFGDSLQTEILSYLSDTNSSVNKYLRSCGDTYNITSKIGVYCFMLVLLCGFPIQFNSISDIFIKVVPHPYNTESNRQRFILILFGICILLALVEGLNIKILKTFYGATCSSPIAFIYPFIYYLFYEKGHFGMIHTFGIFMMLTAGVVGMMTLINLFFMRK